MAARFRPRRSRTPEAAPGTNRARRSTIRADRRGPKFGSNSANTSPGSGPMRKSGRYFRGHREVGYRGPAKKSHGWRPRSHWRREFGRPIARLEAATGANGARKSTIRADRRGPKFESNSAHTSPDFGPLRKCGIPGAIGKSDFGIPSRIGLGGGGGERGPRSFRRRVFGRPGRAF